MRVTAREFFERVREAALDADRCKQQMDELDSRLHVIGGGGYEPRTSGNVEADKIGRRVASYLDRKSKLDKRAAEDWALVDRACIVLYGDDQVSGGLCKVKSGEWADTLWWRFCAADTWDGVARATNNSRRHCQETCGWAMLWIDKNKFADRIINMEHYAEQV